MNSKVIVIPAKKKKRKFHQGIRKEETEGGSLCEGINR